MFSYLICSCAIFSTKSTSDMVKDIMVMSDMSPYYLVFSCETVPMSHFFKLMATVVPLLVLAALFARNPVTPGLDEGQRRSVSYWLLPIHEAGHGNKTKDLDSRFTQVTQVEPTRRQWKKMKEDDQSGFLIYSKPFFLWGDAFKHIFSVFLVSYMVLHFL